MSTPPVELLIRDRSSGRIHRRWRQEGSVELLSPEGDNADQAGDYDFVDQAAVDAAPASELCQRCFAEDERYRDDDPSEVPG